MRPMRALMPLPFLLLALVPAASATEAPPLPPAEPGLPGPVECLVAPGIPETPLYYVVFSCTAGQLGVPEPIYLLTGCTMGFPATNIECQDPPQHLVAEAVEFLEETVSEAVRFLGETVSWVLIVLEDTVTCLVAFPETPVYYVVFYCTAGRLGVPEPIYLLTGCTMGYPTGTLECAYPPEQLVADVEEALDETIDEAEGHVDEARILVEFTVAYLVDVLTPEHATAPSPAG